MLVGMLVNRAVLPQVLVRGGSLDDLEEVAIDEWMGASPVYTGRMRRLVGIEGDGVDAVMKALQLDCGFVHEYMRVGYRYLDHDHAEFWLDRCGALLDVEPFGEERVHGMCHTIEDPTFDATALATNPRARIRPIHRPPRVPADREPHCHWTLTIDPADDPVGPTRLTEQVAGLPLASVANEVRPEPEPDGMTDYRGAFDPDFRLADLSTGALAAVARELCVQAHLLVCSGELALAGRFGADTARDMVAEAWAGVGWIAGERLAAALGVGPGPEGLASVLSLTAALPPGLARRVDVDGDRVRFALTPTTPGLLDPDHPGWSGLLARGERRGLEAAAHGFDPRARLVALTVTDGRVVAELVLDGDARPVTEPDVVALTRIGPL
ncbi:MAG: hypothetical protein M5U14_20325 [Acidimicrobiia bacterium]|nr:hypothetical protein [Acidimicrobiia bacterium]